MGMGTEALSAAFALVKPGRVLALVSGSHHSAGGGRLAGLGGSGAWLLAAGGVIMPGSMESAAAMGSAASTL